MRLFLSLGSALLLGAIAALCWWVNQDEPPPVLTAESTSLGNTKGLIGTGVAGQGTRVAFAPETTRMVAPTPSGTLVVADIADSAGRLHAAETTVQDDLEILESMIEFFRRANGDQVPSGGLNEEIVAQMRGANDRRIAVFPEKHPSLNAQGQLLDRWGTPYYFHPVSHTVIELRSAGPDGKLWTADDVQRGEPEETETDP